MTRITANSREKAETMFDSFKSTTASRSDTGTNHWRRTQGSRKKGTWVLPIGVSVETGVAADCMTRV